MKKINEMKSEIRKPLVGTCSNPPNREHTTKRRKTTFFFFSIINLNTNSRYNNSSKNGDRSTKLKRVNEKLSGELLFSMNEL